MLQLHNRGLQHHTGRPIIIIIGLINAGVRELEAPQYKCEAPIIGGLGTEPPMGNTFGFWTFTESRKFAHF